MTLKTSAAPPKLTLVEAWNRGRWAGAIDALAIVRGLNGNGHDEPSDPALTAAEDAIRNMIEHRHGAGSPGPVR